MRNIWLAVSALIGVVGACNGSGSSVPSGAVIEPGGIGAVIEPGGIDDPVGIDGLLVTTRGVTAVIHHSQGYRVATTWGASGWTRHPVYVESYPYVFDPPQQWTASQIEGRVTVIDAAILPEVARWWRTTWAATQQDDGEFAPPEVVLEWDDLGHPAKLVSRARYTAGDGVLAAVGTTAYIGPFEVFYLEHVDGGGWHSEHVSPVTWSGIDAAGVGRLADGTAIVASFGGEGLWLHRRTDAWAQLRQLASGNVPYANVEFPPEGARDGAVALAVYSDAVTQHPRGMLVSLADGSPGGDGDLLDTAIAALDAQIVFAPDGLSAKLLLWDRQQHLAYLVDFTGTSFLPAQQLRPDLVFDAAPRLVYHPTGGYLILYVARLPGDPPGSQAAWLLPLDELGS